MGEKEIHEKRKRSYNLREKLLRAPSFDSFSCEHELFRQSEFLLCFSLAVASKPTQASRAAAPPQKNYLDNFFYQEKEICLYQFVAEKIMLEIQKLLLVP